MGIPPGVPAHLHREHAPRLILSLRACSTCRICEALTPMQPSHPTSFPLQSGEPWACRSPSRHVVCRRPVRTQASSVRSASRAASSPCRDPSSLGCWSVDRSTPARGRSCDPSYGLWRRRASDAWSCACSPWSFVSLPWLWVQRSGGFCCPSLRTLRVRKRCGLQSS